MSTTEGVFRFLDPGQPADGELELRLIRTAPAEPERDFVPCYNFEMHCDGCTAGRISLRIGNTRRLYYGGHIGYVVEPEFRGRHLA